MHNLQKIGITHDAIIDFVIANPSSTYRQIAGAFEYSPEGIGIIVRSDAFKARLETRRSDLVDPLIRRSVEERLTGLAHSSLDILQAKLATSDDPKLALAALDLATKASQYGARANLGSHAPSFVVQLPGPASNSEEWTLRFGRAIVPAETVIEG